MPAQVVLYLGPVRCGKTRELLRLYREALAGVGPGAGDHVLWLAPTVRNAATVRQQLIADGIGACLSPGTVTFDQLTNQILNSSGSPPPVVLSAAANRELVRRVISAVAGRGKLVHYRDAARRGGFADLVVGHFRELQRHRIDPSSYLRAAARHQRAAEHRELALLYEEYQQQLDEHGLCDAEGRHAAACKLLADDAGGRFRDLELVVADGFSDFTLVQHELLCLLAQRAKKLIVTLPCDASTSGAQCGRPDLFAKSSATAAELKHFHPKLQTHLLPQRTIEWPALDHLAQHLFRNPRQVPTLSAEAAESLARLEVVEAAGPQDEIVQLARHIKTRVLNGTARPGDIVVAFRSLNDAAPRVREVFASFGIPFSLEARLPLATASILRTLLSLLRLDDEDWPFRRVISVVTNNTLSAIDAEARRAADWLVRDLQIAQGREVLVGRVTQLAEIDMDARELSEHAKRRAEEAKCALPVLQSLPAALDELPKEADAMEWIAALERFGTKLGMPSMSDDAVWQAIAEQFAAFHRLDTALGESPGKLTRRNLLRFLIDLAGHEFIREPFDEAGRVRVLSAATARTVTARHLYLAGMSEQAFPSPERAGLLATDADYRFFAGAADQEYAAACPPPVTRPQEEMLLFHEVLTRAEESITISYPALDEKAQVLPPSPYVTELLRTLRDARSQVKCTPPHLSPVPAATAPPSSPNEWRIQAIVHALGEERDIRMLAGIFQDAEMKPAGAALEAGLRITHTRQRRDDFGPAEGVITSPAAAARLAQRFGPKHLWSPSQWEHYAACPYQFYLQSVLKLEPLGDLVLETDHRRRGSLLHHVLATFHRQFGAAPAEIWDALTRDEERFIAEMGRTLQATIESMPRHGIDAALVELDRRQIEKWTGGYLAQHEQYSAAWATFDEPLRPAHFELRFGPRRPGDEGPEDPSSVDKAFPLDIGGETILVTGRIDRIDVGRIGDRTVFNVIDYKSGRRPTLTGDKLESGERLQPAIYVMAAEMLVFGAGGKSNATPLWAGYWSMQNGTTTDARYSLRCSTDSGESHQSWAEVRPKVLQRIGQFVADIRQGRFPVASRDPDCTSRCEYNTVCRVAQIRSLGKVWPSDLTPDT